MNKKATALLGVILGGLTLSLELFLLKVLQSLEKLHGSWWTNAMNYAAEVPCALGFLVTAAVILFSLAVYFTAKD